MHGYIQLFPNPANLLFICMTNVSYRFFHHNAKHFRPNGNTIYSAAIPSFFLPSSKISFFFLLFFGQMTPKLLFFLLFFLLFPLVSVKWALRYPFFTFFQRPVSMPWWTKNKRRVHNFDTFFNYSKMSKWPFFFL